MNTIVSAFISNINDVYENSLKRYYSFGKLLLKSTTPKIIFVDEIMFELIGEDYNKKHTLIVKIDKKKSYLYGYANQLTNFYLNSEEYNKHTIEFILTICNKTEWIRDAIYLNYFKTTHFIWIDFNIRESLIGIINGCTDDEFIEKINNLVYKCNNGVRIGGVWNINYEYNIDIYRDMTWYFVGGIFGGNINSLIKFADLMKSKCIDIITSKNTLMWEVNVWYLIYKENKVLFNTYGCCIDKKMIDNY